MALKVYYESDADLDLLKGKKIAVIGYGSQGHAHAREPARERPDVIVGLYEGSSSKAKAEADVLTVMNTADAAKAADIVMILTPDETQHEIFERDIKPNLQDGDTVMVAHGFNILYGRSCRRRTRRRLDDRAEEPRPSGARSVRHGERRPRWWRCTRMPAANALRQALAYGKGIAYRAASSRRRSRTRPRRTTSASRRCRALVTAAFETLTEAATRLFRRTSSACTS